MNIILPLVAVSIFIIAIIKKVNITEAFAEGVIEGFETVKRIFPILLLMLSAIYMFRASGGFDVLVFALTPAANLVNIPGEVLPLAVLRSFSGSGSIALLNDLLTQYGADSYIGRLAAVLAASTETTIYTISVYLGGLTKYCGKILLCAFLCDILTVIIAVIAVNIFY